MPFRYLDEIATADVAFAASGTSREELFAAVAAALLQVMVENPEEIERRETVEISVTSAALDLLLFAFLQELIFYKDARQLLLRVDSLIIGERDEDFSLTAVAAGEKIDPRRHHLGVDVKAVTLHRFRVEEKADGWEATVVVDV